jgi:hypothetical protein
MDWEERDNSLEKEYTASDTVPIMNTASATGVPIHEYHRHGDVDVNQD